MVVTRRFSNTQISSALNSMPASASASASATPLPNPTPVSPSLFKSIFLHEWWLVKPQLQCEGLAIGGIASFERERVFLSTAIAKRHEANVLETKDGITIVFRGFINVSRTCENGFPSEVSHHFLFGFPHDWKKYTVHSNGDEYIDGVTGFGNSDVFSRKRADDALPFSIHDNDLTVTEDFLLFNNGVLNHCSAPKEFCNELGNSLGNVSKQFQSTDNMECNIAMQIMECEYKDNTSLQSSRPQVDMMHNGENGISNVAVESQAGNPECYLSSMGMHDPNPCTVLSGKSTVKSPIILKRMRKGRLSIDCKEKQFIRQKILEDAVNTCSRRVTRSISRTSHAVLKKDEKFTVACVSSPVRRSPRLYNCRK